MWPFLLKCGKKWLIPSPERLVSGKWHHCFLCLPEGPASPTYEESFWLSDAPCLSKHLPQRYGCTVPSLLPLPMHHS